MSATAGPRTSTADWVSGARPRTLPLSIVSVVLGTGVAVADGGPGAWTTRDHTVPTALLCLVVAVCLQVGVNFTNDYSDGVRGTDAFRRGPARLTGAGRARPGQVLAVGLTFFGIAAVAGLVVVLLTRQWWMLPVGAVTIVAAWYYTGGRRPYGYRALGEVSVFVFFGLVAVLGTEVVQIGRATAAGWLTAAAAGSFACAVLMVNNVRDVPVDRQAGKRTLAVVVGERTARLLYVVFLAAPFVLLVPLVVQAPWTAVGYAALALAGPAAVVGVRATAPPALVTALQLSSYGSLLFGVLVALALVLSA